jgi:hypothetical protein
VQSTKQNKVLQPIFFLFRLWRNLEAIIFNNILTFTL